MKCAGVLAGMLVFALCESSADALLPPKPGRGCAGSSQFLEQNLPLGPMRSVGGDRYDTDVTDIVAFGTAVGSVDSAGWLYTNRRGDLVLEVRKGHNAEAARALAKAAAPQSADIALVAPVLGFAALPTRESAGLEDRLARAGELRRCFTKPLP